MKTVKKAQALLLGTCYDPEKWDSEVQKEDLRRMQEAGIEMISPEKGENDSDGRMQSEPKPGQLMLSGWSRSVMERIGSAFCVGERPGPEKKYTSLLFWTVIIGIIVNWQS